MSIISESDLEKKALEWFQELGYQYIYGPVLAPEGKNQERKDFKTVILEDRLRLALQRINNDIPNPNNSSSIKIMPLGASRVEGGRPNYESYRFYLWKNLYRNR